MKTVFLDTSVIFSACLSKIGASALILGYCRRRRIQGYISSFVIKELRENAEIKFNQIQKQRLNFFMQQSHLLVINELTEKEIEVSKKLINIKDAPILAAAFKSKAAYLITLNTNDFMLHEVKKSAKSLKILTPRDFVMQHFST